MFCVKCGKQLVDGAQFCTYCGYQIKTKSGVSDNVPYPNTSSIPNTSNVQTAQSSRQQYSFQKYFSNDDFGIDQHKIDVAVAEKHKGIVMTIVGGVTSFISFNIGLYAFSILQSVVNDWNDGWGVFFSKINIFDVMEDERYTSYGITFFVSIAFLIAGLIVLFNGIAKINRNRLRQRIYAGSASNVEPIFKDSSRQEERRWQCTCGRINPIYVGTCACGRKKY